MRVKIGLVLGAISFTAMGLAHADLLTTLTGGNPFPGKPEKPDTPSLYDQWSQNPQIEAEPNNDQASANPMMPALPMKGVFSSREDQDWFVIETTQDNATVKIETAGSGLHWTLWIVDKNGNFLVSRDIDDNRDQTFSFLLTQKGKYYFLARPRENPEEPYMFQVSGDNIIAPTVPGLFQQLISKASGELEPNDNIRSASPINPGQPVKGILFQGDKDWFAIGVTQPNTEVTVDLPAAEGTENDVILSVFDSMGNIVTSAQSQESDLSFFFVAEKPGVYNFSVTPVNDEIVPFEYVFQVQGADLIKTERNASPNKSDVEIEPNDALTQAVPISSAVEILGNLFDGDDIDIYELNSPGDEVLSVELCPRGSHCAQQMSSGDGGAWVAYVFDGSKLTQSMLDTVVNLTDCSNDTVVSVPIQHLYLTKEVTSVLDPALLAVIDPKFGNANRVQIGLRNPGQYFVVVSSVLKRDKDTGSVIQEETIQCGEKAVVDADGNPVLNDDGTTKTEPVEIVKQTVTVFPFSDDEYDLIITTTGLTPSSASSRDAQLASMQAYFEGDVMHLPLVDINGLYYSQKMRFYQQDDKFLFELLQSTLLSPQPSAQDLSDPQLSALRADLTNGILHIPMVDINGQVFTGALLKLDDTHYQVIWAQALN